tara:strand:- start:731 stop:2278 length:1548 start_codon:yes stop_codon:yes gene_type:complete
MSQQRLQNLAVSAPAFFGINTEESPVGLNPNYADIADNCVIDKQGRIGARQGYTQVSESFVPTVASGGGLGTSRGIEAVFEFTFRNGTIRVYSAGNNKIFYGTVTLREVILPSGYTITANNWKIVALNNNVYFFQDNHVPLVAVTGSNTLVTVASVGTTPPSGNEVLAAFGRLWVADVDGNNYTVYYSDLVNGTAWTGGSSGSLNLTEVWPNGYDEIVALAEHNGFLLIFGKHSIVIYSGGDTVTTAEFRLSDTIEGVGCIARDSVQATGNDILFLSDRGLMSLGRIIQEKSLPLRDVSANVRTDLLTAVKAETLPIQSHYSAFDAFYLITLPTTGTTYCFDVRTPLENGSFRATTWSGLNPVSFTNAAADGFYIGLEGGLAKYGGYLDGTATYKMSYFSNPIDWGNTSNLKFLKKFNITVIGGGDTSYTLSWSYDYTENYQKQLFSFPSGAVGEYNISEYNTTAEYSGGVFVNKGSVHTNGSGVSASIGVESTINGTPFSIQTIDIHALLGRLI